MSDTQDPPYLVGAEPAPRRDATSPEQSIETLDVGFIRVLEDLIDALLANGVLRLTDLPPQALEKLHARKRARKKLRDSLDLLDDDNPLI